MHPGSGYPPENRRFLFIQIWFPYFPLYSIAYMLGTCLLHAFVVDNEKEEYRRHLEETEKIKSLHQTITSLIDNIPGLTFTKDAETGVYLACNQAFATYAHKETPEGVTGLSVAPVFERADQLMYVNKSDLKERRSA